MKSTITTREAAQVWGVSYQRAQKIIEEKAIPTKTVGSRVFVDKAAVERERKERIEATKQRLKDLQG